MTTSSLLLLVFTTTNALIEWGSQNVIKVCQWGKQTGSKPCYSPSPNYIHNYLEMKQTLLSNKSNKGWLLLTFVLKHSHKLDLSKGAVSNLTQCTNERFIFYFFSFLLPYICKSMHPCSCHTSSFVLQ